MHSFTFRDVNQALPSLAHAVLTQGEEVGSRNGRCKELTHVSVQLTEPLNREIMLPERRASLPAQIAESMWILAGRNDIEWLSHYLPRASEFSDDGTTWRGGYGPRIRGWETNDASAVDQLEHVITLLRADPMTRRAVISIYDPVVDTHPGKDIPCNNWLHFLNRGGQLDLAVTIRSNDLIWGWSGINAFEWSVLLEVVAGMVGVPVGTLTFHISSLHIYEKHWQRARQIANTETADTGLWAANPRFGGDASRRGVKGLDALLDQWFAVEEAIRAGLPVDDRIIAFPEPMLGAWLEVLHWWWQGGPSAPLRLQLAAEYSPNRPKQESQVPLQVQQTTADFKAYVAQLQRDKDAAYGDSWCRRGEMLGIMANIARKVDRLGVTDDHETAADTAVDLWVYLLKYRLWLMANVAGTPHTPGTATGLPHGTHADQVAALVNTTRVGVASPNEWPALIETLRQQFDQLEADVTDHYPSRWSHVDDMAANAAILARSQWADSQWRAGNATRPWNPEAGQ